MINHWDINLVHFLLILHRNISLLTYSLRKMYFQIQIHVLFKLRNKYFNEIYCTSPILLCKNKFRDKFITVTEIMWIYRKGLFILAHPVHAYLTGVTIQRGGGNFPRIWSFQCLLSDPVLTKRWVVESKQLYRNIACSVTPHTTTVVDIQLTRKITVQAAQSVVSTTDNAKWLAEIRNHCPIQILFSPPRQTCQPGYTFYLQ